MQERGTRSAATAVEAAEAAEPVVLVHRMVSGDGTSQQPFAAALRHWPDHGVPDAPEAWLAAAARGVSRGGSNPAYFYAQAEREKCGERDRGREREGERGRLDR